LTSSVIDVDVMATILYLAVIATTCVADALQHREVVSRSKSQPILLLL